MVQLAASPKTPKMGKTKTPKKSNGVTPAKAEVVKTPKQAKNTPAKAALQTPKAAPQTLKNGTASAKKAKKVKTPKQKPVEDVEMASEEEELAEPSPKKDESVQSEDVKMSAEEEDSTIKSDTRKPMHVSHRPTHDFLIFVKGLNSESSDYCVRKHFSQFGHMVRCSIPKNHDKKGNKGFCFVEYVAQEHVDKVLASAHTIDARILTVSRGKHDEVVRKRKCDESTQDSQTPPKPKKKCTEPRERREKEIFLAKLNLSTSMESIKKHFSQFGEVVSVRLPANKIRNLNKGYAFVKFADVASFEKAIANDKQVIDSANVVVCKANEQKPSRDDRPKQSNPNELYIDGLDYLTQKSTLEKHFSKYGKVAKITLPWSLTLMRNKGFAFVSFESAESLAASLEEDHEIDNRRVYTRNSKDSHPNSASSEKVETKKVKAAAEKSEEEDDEEMEGDEAESEDEEEEEEAGEVDGDEDDEEEEEEGEVDEEEDDNEEEEEEESDDE